MTMEGTVPDHRAYPIRRGDRRYERCTCGGVRHFHAPAPNGCDDCEECSEFTLAEVQPRTPFSVRRVGAPIPNSPHVRLSVFAGRPGINVGLLVMEPAEAEDLMRLLSEGEV